MHPYFVYPNLIRHNRSHGYRQRCFVEQYGNFSFQILEQIAGYEGPTNVSGTQTLGENIAGMS